MLSPLLLKKNDKVGIVAPASRVDKDIILNNIKIIEKWGLKAILGDNIFNNFNAFSASDQDRITDMQKMLDDTEIKAIFCARGGYGSIRIINKLDFRQFAKKPKWIIGFSDITVFHAYINRKLKIESIHGPVVNSWNNSQSLSSIKNCLFNGAMEFHFKPDKHNIEGYAEGELIGGNLSILYSLTHIEFNYDFTNKIIIIEDINEQLYHIDRIMQNLKLSGQLKKIKGLLIGQFTNIKKGKYPFGQSLQQIISDAVKGHNYPIAFNCPVGHTKINDAFIVGRNVTLEVTQKGTILKG